MHPAANRVRAVLIILCVGVCASNVSAQSKVYVTGVGLADIRQFDSIEYGGQSLSSLTNSSLDGTAAGGGLRIGTFLHPRWSLELAVDAGSRSTATFPDLIEIFPTPSSSLTLHGMSANSSFVTVSTVVGFRPAKLGRVSLGYLGGFALVRGSYRSTEPDYQSFASFEAFVGIDAGFGPASSSSSAVTFPTLPMVAAHRRDNAAGGLVGLEAAVDVTRRLSIVPGLRTIVFSSQGRSVFLIRPEVGVRWSF